eukprot:3016905-Rhodomonas_salina.1
MGDRRFWSGGEGVEGGGWRRREGVCDVRGASGIWKRSRTSGRHCRSTCNPPPSTTTSDTATQSSEGVTSTKRCMSSTARRLRSSCCATMGPGGQ